MAFMMLALVSDSSRSRYEFHDGTYLTGVMHALLRLEFIGLVKVPRWNP